MGGEEVLLLPRIEAPRPVIRGNHVLDLEDLSSRAGDTLLLEERGHLVLGEAVALDGDAPEHRADAILPAELRLCLGAQEALGRGRRGG